MWELILPIINSILPGVLNRILPAEKMSELDKTRLQMELTKELMNADWQHVQAEYDDRNSARLLAGKDIASGNAFTGFLAATVRPAWGFGALALVVYSVGWHFPIDSNLKDIINTVLFFYFGGRTLEKVTPHISAGISNAFQSKGK